MAALTAGSEPVAELPTGLTKESLRQIIQMQPGSESAARAQYQLGALSLAGGEVETATASYREVPSSWPRWHSRAGFAIARLYESQLGDLAAAAREYRKVISSHPDSMAAARSYARLGSIYRTLGDAVSCDNMRECAMRTYQRLSERSEDPEERDEALLQFAVTGRQLQRWEPATEALMKCRARAVRARDAARRVQLDRELGLIFRAREQHGNALKRFRDCLEHARRKSDLYAVAELTGLIVECQVAAGQDSAARATQRSFVTFVHRGKLRLAEAQKDPEVAPRLVEAYLAVDRVPDARAVRARLRRQKGEPAAAALAWIDAALGAQGSRSS